jgi:hypothetical protein
MKGKIIECYGCGSASCSMCSVFECKSEKEALSKLIRENGLEWFIKHFPKANLNYLKERDLLG